MTRTRELILKAVLRQSAPFSAADLLRAMGVRRKGNSVDLVTIYRNLPIFEAAGIICRADITPETAHFVVASDAHGHHHHHIICRSCHRVEAVDRCAVQEFDRALRKLGFTQVDHKLEFSGICRDCI